MNDVLHPLGSGAPSRNGEGFKLVQLTVLSFPLDVTSWP